jgi:hypothetical protein
VGTQTVFPIREVTTSANTSLHGIQNAVERGRQIWPRLELLNALAVKQLRHSLTLSLELLVRVSTPRHAVVLPVTWHKVAAHATPTVHRFVDECAYEFGMCHSTDTAYFYGLAIGATEQRFVVVE